MTKAQKRRNEINGILVAHGATIDRYGQYHIGNYKFDTRKTNLKIFNKVKGKKDDKIFSKAMGKLDISLVKTMVEKIRETS